MSQPVLSLILCSRNDHYMGNSRWRLEAALNYAGDLIQGLGRSHEAEILVADWGSEIPLGETVVLGPSAAKIVSFVWVSPALAGMLQRDSPFPEVLALNAAARRARGAYIGRIDQDTLVGERFFRWFFEWTDGVRLLDVPLETALLFANRRGIPYRFAARCPSLPDVQAFVRLFGRLLPVWRANPERGDVFWTSYVGIWLAHRSLWAQCGGYDERLIYYNWMETDMICRLSQKYPVIDLGKLIGYDFYHLDHHDPRLARVARRHGKKNPDIDLAAPPAVFHPNPESWGLAHYPLAALPYSPRSNHGLAGAPERRHRISPFVRVMLTLSAEMTSDWIESAWTAGKSTWGRRFRTARRALVGQPVTRWPATLWRLWAQRKL